MQTVFIVSGDWSLRTGLRAELRERGVDARGLETLDELAQALAAGVTPAVVVLDADQVGAPGALNAVCNLSGRLPVVLVASGAAPAPEVPGAELLRRPVRVGEIAERVLQRLSPGP